MTDHARDEQPAATTLTTTTPTATATQGRPFAILPAHPMRPGWDWFVERLTRPIVDEAHDTKRDDRDVA